MLTRLVSITAIASAASLLGCGAVTDGEQSGVSVQVGSSEEGASERCDDPNACGEGCHGCRIGSECVQGACVCEERAGAGKPGGGCGAVGPEGWCDGHTLQRCVEGALQETDCLDLGRGCGWDETDNDGFGAFDCVTVNAICPGVPDSGRCDGDTLVWCDTKTGEIETFDCKSDGQKCAWTGSFFCCHAEADCVPMCSGRECGDDGCGGSCGECGEGATCEGGLCKERACDDAQGHCEGDVLKYCTGDCPVDVDCAKHGKVCGTNPTTGLADCVPGCSPSCDGKECGDDGCGGACGECAEGQTCMGGRCGSACTPSCEGLQCGDDGCGGSCGECPAGTACETGRCRPAKRDLCNGVDDDGDGTMDEDGQADCEDFDPCTKDACWEGQCVHSTGKANGTACDDGDPCTDGDACHDGKCTGLACEPTPCVRADCVPDEGCVRLVREGPCDDGDACTSGDHCVEGQCQSGEDVCD